MDEVDQLESKHQEILYTMFEWPSLPNAKLILIGMFAGAVFCIPRIAKTPYSKYFLIHCRYHIFFYSHWVGIANALDLTDRILPRLQARPKCKYEYHWR